MKNILHLDLDAFFVSVERILDPRLEGKPVIVGGDPHGRGVVAACSYEARSYGLHSAMPIGTAYKLCPQGVYLHGHYDEYVYYSEAVKHILEEYAPVLEQASIDEFYMDFTGCWRIYGDVFSLASRLQSKIFSSLSLPCSIGIGSNKTIAKIASDCLKPKGITYVLNGMEKEFLRLMPVETMPGVGKVMLQELNSRGFYKLGEVAKAPAEYFAAAFGQCGLDLWNKANGSGSRLLSIAHERKSISKETTFDQDITDKSVIEETLFKLTAKVCQTMRDENWQTSNVSLKLRYSDFVTLTRAKTLRATDDDKIIFETILDLFRKVYSRRIAVRLVGVHLSKFSLYSEQEFLFDDEIIKRNKMIKAVSQLRGKYGFSAISLGQ